MAELQDAYNACTKRVNESSQAMRDELDNIIYELRKENEEKPCEFEDDELPIHLITSDQFYFDRTHNVHYSVSYEKYTLHYNVVTNEIKFIAKNGDIILVENVKELIGDGLMFFGLHSKDPNRVYVRNSNFMSDFEIIKELE